jgi:hypothetical protein
MIACGTTNNAALECASGVACGDGCCANAAEACVMNTTTGTLGCAPSCVTASDCATGCCAPLTDTAGDVTGPYVCQDTRACCNLTICPGASCCVTDTHGNEFCATECADEAQCGGGSTCQSYSFAHTTCDGPMACGPAD